MHFIEVSHRPIQLGHIANIGDRRGISIHRVDGLKCHQLGTGWIDVLELTREVFRIILRKNTRLGTTVADPLHNRGFVLRIWKDKSSTYPATPCGSPSPA